MQKDFHYYATYCAAYLAGYSHEESLDICYSTQYVDCCTRTVLQKLGGPMSAATTQLQLEMMDAKKDIIGLQDITRIWASFHFLPYDLYAKHPKRPPKGYLDKFRLICNPNGQLIVDTVNLAKDRSLQAVGIAMHIMADTWAHRYFAGTPSLAINNTSSYFYELVPQSGSIKNRMVTFKHNPSALDDLIEGIYINTLMQSSENNIMNLGHGRAGHLPDYSYARYRYMPAWADYEEVLKDNPKEYYHAFCQLVYAMQYLHGDRDEFVTDTYAWDTVAPWEKEIWTILEKRQLDSCEDWKALAEKMSGCEVEDFVLEKYESEYMKAPKKKKDDTFLGQFFLAALAQKSMVTKKIFESGNLLAGISVDYNGKFIQGIKDFAKLIKYKLRSGV